MGCSFGRGIGALRLFLFVGFGAGGSGGGIQGGLVVIVVQFDDSYLRSDTAVAINGYRSTFHQRQRYNTTTSGWDGFQTECKRAGRCRCWILFVFNKDSLGLIEELVDGLFFGSKQLAEGFYQCWVGIKIKDQRTQPAKKYFKCIAHCFAPGMVYLVMPQTLTKI